MKTDSSSPSSSGSYPVAEQSLRSGRLGVVGIVFFVVAAASPLVGMTGALPAAILLGNGAAAPGAYLLAGLILLLFSVGYAAMSHQVTNSGAFFAYIGRGMGLHFGVGSAFVSLLAYLAIHLSIFGFFGGLMAEQVGVLPWWGWSLVAWAAVTWLSLRSVDVGAHVLGLLMGLELLSLVVTAAAIFLQGGPEGLNFAASFSPANILAGGLAGSAGIALAFAFASFVGFEATAIYGEESIDPKRTVPLATYVAVVLITILFAFTSFAVVTGLGAGKLMDHVAELSSVDGTPLVNPANVLFTLAGQYVGGWLATMMKGLVLSSLFAAMLAFQNSAARYLFALGRGGTLPAALANVNARGAPSVGSIIVSVITAAVIALFAVAGLDPILNMFFWFSGLAVVSILLIEILVCLAVIAWFRRVPGDSNLFQSLIAPVLATIGLSVGLYLLLARFGLLTGAVAEGMDPTTTSWAMNGLGWFMALLPFGVLVLGYLFAIGRHRENKGLIQDVIS
ncbi:APC family permease [Rhodoferax sp.]|uniref:APC family permease n=1 Tax=Rhodoferax sp. TaxID=50421 RepID=UPI002ACEE385|nr:APC family permease [Rhodoferax sp.]MDZ7920509.1 APC family permease [Rhodoferax sp.]